MSNYMYFKILSFSKIYFLYSLVQYIIGTQANTEHDHAQSHRARNDKQVPACHVLMTVRTILFITLKISPLVCLLISSCTFPKFLLFAQS